MTDTSGVHIVYNTVLVSTCVHIASGTDSPNWKREGVAFTEAKWVVRLGENAPANFKSSLREFGVEVSPWRP